jgi:LEA14-like dessication related protein
MKAQLVEGAMRKIALVTAWAAMLAGAACSTLGRAGFEQPVVTLKDVKIRGLGITGGNLDVVLNVYNPNHYRLDATRLTYKVMLSDSVTVATGAVDSRFTVQDRDSTTVPIPVQFTYTGIGEAGRQLLQMGAVNYRVLGDVTVGSVVGNFTIPYSSTGRFTTTGVSR